MSNKNLRKLSEIYEQRFQTENFTNQIAAFTHYLHNSKNGVSKSFEKDAINFVIESFKSVEWKLNRKEATDTLKKWIKLNSFETNKPRKSEFKFIDLFAGIGGIRLAAQQSGGHCVFSSEYDEYAQKTYYKNFGEIPFGDIKNEDVKKYIPQKFDLLCAGFPCQPFSYAGLNKGFKDKVRGTLFFDILDILEKHQPQMFLLENVKGLKSHDGGKTLKTIEQSLMNLGYNIQWKILNSYHFGLPQYRERWYCVGFKNKVKFEFPEPVDTRPILKDIISESSNKDLKLKLSSFELERIKFHFQSNEIRVKHDNSKYAKDTKKGKHGVYSFLKSDGSLRFHIGDRSKTQIQEAYYASMNTYAPTIIANRVPKLWDLKRKLSVLESQRLQGFPDDFVFPVSDNQAYKQLGNSVAVPVVQAIINNMMLATII